MKTKTILRLIPFTMILMLIAAPSASPQAQGVDFTDTFDDPSLPGWEHSPNATVADGWLHIEPSGFAFHGGRWSDLTLSITVRLTGSGAALIQYRATDQSAYIIRFAGSLLVLQRKSGSVITNLATANIEIPSGESAAIGVTNSGSRHQIMVNGNLKITASDSQPLPPGGLYLFAEGTTAEFDEVTLTGSGQAGPNQALGVTPATSIPQPTSMPGSASTATSASSSGVPAYQSGSWVRTGGPIGGLGYDIRVNFKNHTTWYVTDAFSGFYISTDNGLTWTPSNEGITAVSPPDAIPIFSATVDPHNPDTIWIGTNATGDIFKSTDGGHNWVEMTNGIDPKLRPLTFRGFTIDPHSSDIVYAMAEISSSAWTPDHSLRAGLEMDMTQGIVYKTIDGGQNWQQVWRGDNLARYMWIDPRDSNVLYVSTGIFDREAANTDVAKGFAGGVGILKSTDGGQTWRVLNEVNGLTDLFVGSLYMKPDNPDALLAAASENNWSTYQGRDTAGVYLTEDGGEHWTRVVSGELFSVVEYCTSDPNVAYAAGSHAVYRSNDGGHTWQKFTRSNNTWGPPGIVAGFPIDFQCDPENPMRVFDNNYLGGNFLSGDGGQTWTLASRGYTGEQVYQVVVAPGHPEQVFTASRSGIFYTNDGGNEWIGLINPPDDMKAKMNEVLTVAMEPTNSSHLLIAPLDLGGILYSQDNGQNWTIGQAAVPASNILFAPSDSSTVYAVATPKSCIGGAPAGQLLVGKCADPANGLYISHDGGLTWQAAKSQQVSGGIQIDALAIHPNDANTLYVAIPDAGVLKSTDGGQSWSQSGQGLPSLPALSLAIDPSNPNIIFAGLGASGSGVGGAGLYRSADGGRTWSQSNNGLPAEALILSIIFDPTNDQVVYVGDRDSGVYVSTDGGQNWRSLNQGLTHKSVTTLALSDDGMVLYAGTWGDGVYRLGMPPLFQIPASASTSTAVAPSPQSTATPASGTPCTGSLFAPLALFMAAWWLKRR